MKNIKTSALKNTYLIWKLIYEEYFFISTPKMRDSSYLVIGLLIEIMLHKSVSSLVAVLRNNPKIWNVTRLPLMVLCSSQIAFVANTGGWKTFNLFPNSRKYKIIYFNNKYDLLWVSHLQLWNFPALISFKV